jgi:hypothetical protein
VRHFVCAGEEDCSLAQPFIPIQQGYIRGVYKNFGEWYQKTNKTEDTIKLTLN